MTRPVSLPVRVLLVVAAAYCFTLFVAMHARATDSFYEFLWPIAPPTSAFIGAWFGALAVGFLAAAITPTWPEVRTIVTASIVAVVVLLYAPLSDTAQLEANFVLGRVWLLGLGAALIALPIAILYQQLLVLPSRPHPALAPVVLRRAHLGAGLLLWIMGLIMVVTPGVLQSRWPWHCFFPGECLGALPERDAIAVGGVLLGTGLILWYAAVEGSVRTLRLASIFGFLAGATSLYGVIRFWEYIEEGWWSTPGLVGFQALLIALSLATLAHLHLHQRRSKPA
ncbi:MAG: hypothetical protein GEU28_00445 [Dehalococcoidia bacterium]|nr:hypothetical protein [Dehalococcoidia bacterium]